MTKLNAGNPASEPLFFVENLEISLARFDRFASWSGITFTSSTSLLRSVFLNSSNGLSSCSKISIIYSTKSHASSNLPNSIKILEL
ncbi:hypothetical protein OGAPHI_001845 [Ogataea philodendri]|uniref:Uncharacterized protein n=1 Tax=Ogataea philodendri TaxID=1378263 RepID=A0A9P8T7L1_9ASCO|nr:uncharacterized protein OGAPHI_001845 [Ogataea philodendri]KAH3668091.1 hypothetical protein OGAPHI_001845 [Ogataea philodendri]